MESQSVPVRQGGICVQEMNGVSHLDGLIQCLLTARLDFHVKFGWFRDFRPVIHRRRVWTIIDLRLVFLAV
jgi:hypothetical protein